MKGSFDNVLISNNILGQDYQAFVYVAHPHFILIKPSANDGLKSMRR